MIKNLIMKLLGIDSPSKQLAGFERNQEELMDAIYRASDLLVLCKSTHAGMADGIGKDTVAKHIDLAATRLQVLRQAYADKQVLIDIVRVTIEADQGIFA